MPAAAWPRRGVYKAGQTVWFVPSKSDEGGYRKVEWHHHPKTGVVYVCSCPRGQHAGQMAEDNLAADLKGHARPCSHVLKVQEAEQGDGYPPRPTAPTNVSALVD